MAGGAPASGPAAERGKGANTMTEKTDAANARGKRGRKAAPSEGRMQGEGDHVAGRRFQEAERSFARKGPVGNKAREAADAMKGPEGAELERARKETGEGKLPSRYAKSEDAGSADPHTDKNLDHGLDETFPASDPVSISPGAD
jgi:hypothetical protein